MVASSQFSWDAFTRGDKVISSTVCDWPIPELHCILTVDTVRQLRHRLLANEDTFGQGDQLAAGHHIAQKGVSCSTADVTEAEQRREMLVSLAGGVNVGHIGILETCRETNKLRALTNVPVEGPFVVVAGFESETDDAMVGVSLKTRFAHIPE